MTTPTGPDDMDDAALEAMVAEAAARKAAAAAKREAVTARSAQVRADRKRRRSPQYVSALRQHPLFAERKGEFWATGYPDQMDDALANLDSVLRTGKEDVWQLDRGTRYGITGTTKARPAVTGPERVIAQFAKVGVTFELSPRGNLAPITTGSAMTPELAAAIKAAEPLVRPYLAGEPAPCDWCEQEAVDVLLCGALVCATHAIGEPSTPKPSLLDRVRGKGKGAA